MDKSVRFSMNEYKPVSLDYKFSAIESEIYDLQLKKQPFVDQKQDIETELSLLNNKLRSSGLLPGEEYSSICSRQDKLKAEKRKIDSELLKIKTTLTQKNKERDLLKMQIKRSPREVIEERLVEMRDKYTQFAADKTRVASMRAMAAEFVAEITSLLK